MEREFFLWIMGSIACGMSAILGLTVYLHKDNTRRLDNINKLIDSIDRRTYEIASRTDRLFQHLSQRTDNIYESFCDLLKEVKNK